MSGESHRSPDLSGKSEWHALPAKDVVQRLGSDVRGGLSQQAVLRLRQIHGENALSGAAGTPAWRRFLLQFSQPLMYILLVAAGITATLGQIIDASVILGVTVVNGIVGFLQESKAEKAIEALSRMVVTQATVRRDGRRQRIESSRLVPGDIVFIQSGDSVPADLRLLHVHGLQVDESALTGESVPVSKQSEPLPTDTPVVSRSNLVFAGTPVTHGQAEGIVIATGNHTETGRIASLIRDVDELTTPLTRKIAHFSRTLLWWILALTALSFAVGVMRGRSLFDMFLASVALAVGAIPEGLPAAVTITLAIGVSRMAKRRAIIRKLPAVEALGSTTVICSDKTGTLTENQMTVQRIFAAGCVYEVTGSGYDMTGEIRTPDGAVVLPQTHAALRETLLAGLLNNDSQLVPGVGGRLKVEGDPTEAALIVVAGKAGLVSVDQHAAHPRLDVIPFESEHQFMATLHGRGEGRLRVIYKKGSVERLLERCSHALADDGKLIPFHPTQIRAAAEEMASSGLRVLAFARREVPVDHHQLRHEHVREGMTFLGLQGMIDPPRAEAIASIRKCREAGISVKMITGDHALTAGCIARQLGLADAGEGNPVAVTGRELEMIADTDLPALAARVNVFARVAPEQKLRLVRALQSSGHVVAMTGDGVNDAPALRQADIGVAMGITGTDVAKGAADMLLLDDNFASIEAAVEEGRGVYDNLTKFIIWTLPTNAAEALVLVAAILVGSELPALPVHFLWVNMMTALLLGMMLAFEPKEHGLMQRAPRDPRQPILTYPLFMRTGLVTLLTLAAAFGAFYWEQHVRGNSLAEARTAVVNVIVMVEVFYLLNCRSLLHSIFTVGVFTNPLIFGGISAMILAQVLFTHLPIMNRIFHTAPMDAASWLYVTGVGVAAYCVVEFEKWLRVRAGEGNLLKRSGK